MSVTLGVTHQFLYPASMVNEVAHTETLKQLASQPIIGALDCWMWRGSERTAEERRILLDCGKQIHYNIGDRFGERIAVPSSRDSTEQMRAYDLVMREIGYALDVNAQKIVLASGPDDAADHHGAIERFGEWLLRIVSQLPSDVELVLEPTDWDIDKHFLLGPLNETVDFIKMIRQNGFEQVGLLMDMCHIPIMHETMESALSLGGEVLRHVHLGNCLISDPSHLFYGDKHIPWSYPYSVYTEDDGMRFIQMLKRIGYTESENATISFEMRPYEGMSPIESLHAFVDVFHRARIE